MGNSASLRARRQNEENLRAAIEASMADAPLPYGWEQAENEKGVTYYINHTGRYTTWDDPRLSFLDNMRKKKPKDKGRLPKYANTQLYAKTQALTAKLHKNQLDDEGVLKILVSRQNLFEDSFNLLFALPIGELTQRLYIKFEGEEGLDYGGMSREWFLQLSKHFYDPSLKLFTVGLNEYYYTINKKSSENKKHLDHFKFVGMIIGMAIYHVKVIEAPFPIPFMKALLNQQVELTDLEYIDEDLYKSMYKIETSDVTDWELDFTLVEESDDGKEKVLVELKPGGAQIPLTNKNKKEYLQLILDYYFNSTTEQFSMIKKGLNMIVPDDLLSEFSPEELQEIICGNSDIDVNDLKQNTVYGDGLSASSPQILTFWECMVDLNQDQLKKFLLFTTGSEKVPVGGFAQLYGSRGPQKFTITQKMTAGLPTAHSCFNRLELPYNLSVKEDLLESLVYAITETCGFGLE
eukprot:TRINITY_DN5602_c0_g1_i1.p1 TRINITY_DN5602_c0_g1~~TRINITY_DN5602_c0_g1_i1.p1  ORF type:complete len:463 (+),score=94.32 TRINITY_DN5602_c0_g1_i1:25-1413(+)